MKWQAGESIEGYQLIRELQEEQGGFGAVWLAESTKGVVRQVVLKIPQLPKAEHEKALRNEAKVWLQIPLHPNLLPILDILEKGHFVVVSHYIPSGSLKTLLPDPFAPSDEETSPLPLEQAVAITEGILAGLEQLHQLSIVHLDLKPANVLMLHHTPLLMDFGLARTIGPDVSGRLASGVTGTRHYMAPEQFGDALAGVKPEQAYQTDLWAVGVLFYQLLCGRLPFRAHPELVAGQILKSEPEPLPEFVPEPYRALVTRALQKERHDRHKNATAMREALREATEATRRARLWQVQANLDTALKQLEEQRTQRSALNARLLDLQEDLATAQASEKLAKLQLAEQSDMAGLKATVTRLEGEKKAAREEAERVKAELAAVQRELKQLREAAVAPIWVAPEFPVPDSTRQTYPLLDAYVKELCTIPGGAFIVGSNDSLNEKPVHEVTLSPFRMGKTPVTVGMWEEYCKATDRVMPTAPSWGWIADHPMINVSWEECVAYCEWASKDNKMSLMLPSESQWEYAARGGLAGGSPGMLKKLLGQQANEGPKFSWGNEMDDSKLWCSVKTARSGTAPVSRSNNVFVNGYGLVDMSGNVWQWCSDWYSTYANEKATDQPGTLTGDRRVVRGGSWYNNDAYDFRCANRDRYAPSSRFDNLGFRLSSPR